MNQKNEHIVLGLHTPQEHLQQLEEIKVAEQPSRSVLCITELGGWAIIGRQPNQSVSASRVIEEVNGMLATLESLPATVEKNVRVVVDYAALRHCLEGLSSNPDCRPSQPQDMQHSTSLPDGQGAVSVVEQLECLGYFSASLIDLLLPNFMGELYLTDEMAAVAIEKGRPEIACLAYGEAFRIDPYLAYQARPRERFEMAALTAGDTMVPQFNIPATKLFEDFMNTGRLHQLPEIEQGFKILVSFLIDADNRIKADSIAVRANPGYEIHQRVLNFANLQILDAYKTLLDSPDINFFADMTRQLLITWWAKADRKQRLELDLEALSRFGLPVSALEGISPKPPESLAALAAIRHAPISPKMAAQPLIAALRDIQRREQA